MNTLVTGGAGYIGSHATQALIKAGHQVTVIDNLFRGHEAAVHTDASFHKIDLLETQKITELLIAHKIECVIHFAALAYVGESVGDPLWYYQNNTAGTISLLQAMKEAKVNRLVFSSTCATYGEPDEVPIKETTPQSPINPYGWSKLFVERILLDYAASNPEFAFAAPRYFNVAGSSLDGSIGEDHTPESHLIPLVLFAAMGKRDSITIFGEDYPTPDGTCIRDYIHVQDLAEAHIALMNSLKPGDQGFFNLGIGKGYSVKEIIDAVKHMTGIDFKVETGDRRAGDPPMLFADPSKIKNTIGWEAKITDIHQIVDSAYQWFKQHPQGYND